MRMTRYLSQEFDKKNSGIAVHDRVVLTESPMHWHNYLELELILEGEGFQRLNGVDQNLHRGCLTVMRLTDYHQVIPGTDLRLLNLMVDDKLLTEEMLGQLMAPQMMFYRLSETETVTMQNLFLLCMEENELPSPDRTYLKHLICCVFLKILKQLPVSPGGGTDMDRGIRAVLLYLRMHFRENPKLQEAADIAHYNASHFSTTFHKQLGMTYSAYLNLLKISYAKELLLSTNLKTSDICFECGFTSQSNFLKLFKEQTGMTPMQFRSRQ